MARFKRILLKLSGESLQGQQGHGIDPERLGDYARQVKEISEQGVQIGIVIGGGNIFRGLQGAGKGFDRVKGDQMGMLATVINSLALSSALTAIGCKNRVLTAIRMEPIGEFYTKWRAIESMEQGEVVIMSCGTGSPYFTTDTGSSLRGIEIEADVMVSIPPTRRRTRQRRSSTKSPTTKCSRATSRSWTSRPSSCAATTACPSTSSTWTRWATCAVSSTANPSARSSRPDAAPFRHSDRNPSAGPARRCLPALCRAGVFGPQSARISSADEMKMDCGRKKFRLRTKFFSTADDFSQNHGADPVRQKNRCFPFAV